MSDDDWDLDSLLDVEQEVEEEEIIIPTKMTTPAEYIASLLGDSEELVGIPLERFVVRSMRRDTTIPFEESIATILCSQSLRRRGSTVSLRSLRNFGLQEFLKASDAVAKQWAPLLAVDRVGKKLPQHRFKTSYQIADPYTLQGSISLIAVSTAIAHLLHETPNLIYRLRTQKQLADAVYISQVLLQLPPEKAVYIQKMLANHRIADVASIALFAFAQERVPVLSSLSLPEIELGYSAITKARRDIHAQTMTLVAELKKARSPQQISLDIFGEVERESGYVLFPFTIGDETPEQYLGRVLQNLRVFKVMTGVVGPRMFGRTKLVREKYEREYDLTDIPPGTIGELDGDGDLVPLDRTRRNHNYYRFARDELERLEEVGTLTGLVKGARIEITRNFGEKGGYGPRHYFYDGDVDRVPLHTKGTLIEISNRDKVRVQLDNNVTWALHPDEIVLEKPDEKEVEVRTKVRTLLTERLPVALTQTKLDLERQIEEALQVYETAGIDRRTGAVVLYGQIDNAEVRKVVSRFLPFSEIAAGLTSGTYEEKALILRKAIADATGHYLLLPTTPNSAGEYDEFLRILPEQVTKNAFIRGDPQKPVVRGNIVAIVEDNTLQMGIYYRDCGRGHHMYREARDTNEQHFNGTLIYGFVGGPRLPQIGAQVKFKKRRFAAEDERVGTIFFSRGEKTALVYFADSDEVNKYKIGRIKNAFPQRKKRAGIQDTVAQIIEKYTRGESNALALAQQTFSTLLLLGYKSSKVRELFGHHLPERQFSYLREKGVF